MNLRTYCYIPKANPDDIAAVEEVLQAMVAESLCNCSFCRNGAGDADSPDCNPLAIVPYVKQGQQAPKSSSIATFLDCNVSSIVCLMSLYAFFLMDRISYGSECLME